MFWLRNKKTNFYYALFPKGLEIIAFFDETIRVRKKAKIRNRYNQAPHLSQDTTWESNKYTIKHHTQESQEVSPFPAGDHRAKINRQENTINPR